MIWQKDIRVLCVCGCDIANEFSNSKQVELTWPAVFLAC